MEYFNLLIGYKASAEKRERRLEKQGAELKESQAEVESLRKSLGKKEKDVEEKEREINSVKQVFIIKLELKEFSITNIFLNCSN